MKIVSTPEKIAHGKYLANHVMICMDCHSTRNWNFYAGPMEPDSIGIGGERFDQRAGFPGVIYRAKHHTRINKQLDRWRNISCNYHRGSQKRKADISGNAAS